MNRETLRTLGLSDEQIDAVTADHGRSMQQVRGRLTEAEKKTQNLQQQLDQTSHDANAEQLVERAELAEKQAASLQEQLSQLAIDHLVNAALMKAGATDMDYARFKLGQLELDQNGKVHDLDQKISQLQTTLPEYFKTRDQHQYELDRLQGFERVNNDLKDGKVSPTNQMDEMIAAFMADVSQ